MYEFILTEKHHCLTLRVMQKVSGQWKLAIEKLTWMCFAVINFSY